MKILLSAFSCGPNWGSEPGIGWNWAVEGARLGHDVTVMTTTEFKDRIEAEIATGDVPSNLEFHFFMPRWLAWIRDLGLATPFKSATWQIVHLVWQILLPFHVRHRIRDGGFDLAHHITLGGIRHPTLLQWLSLPLIVGPLGGGEHAPWALRRSFHWSGWTKDLLRDAHTALLRIDPITRSACARTLAVYVKTRQSKLALPRKHHDRISVRLELGTRGPSAGPKAVRTENSPLRLFYAGQFVYWKGMHLGLRAVAEARAAGTNVQLTMAGRGRDEARWRALCATLGIEDIVHWVGRLPFEAMAAAYRSHDALLFPSLHDSSGNVVLEAMVEGLPVVCLDLGGPGEMIDESCGRVVATEGRDEQQCVAGLAKAIAELAADPDLCRRLSDGALAKSRHFTWPKVVGRLYADAESRLLTAGRRIQHQIAVTGP